MSIKLVLTDLDGTLINSEHEISQETEACVKRLKDKGIRFSFITGRPAFGVKDFATQMEIREPMVGCNGAIIFDETQILQKHSMSLKPLRELMELADSMGMTVLYYTQDEEYAMNVTDWVAIRRSRGRSYPIEVRDAAFWNKGTAEKVNIMAGDGTDFAKLDGMIAKLRRDYEIVCYGKSGCEIVKKGVNKATGMKELAKMLEIPLSDIMAIGDNANDNEMLRLAGMGVAVGNAADDTKACADYICKAENSEGVAEALKLILESGGAILE